MLSAVSPQWRTKLVGVSADVEAIMTGRVRGLTTLIEETTNKVVIRICCGLHQLDLVLQQVYKASLDEDAH
jgi:hypothetical protein